MKHAMHVVYGDGDTYSRQSFDQKHTRSHPDLVLIKGICTAGAGQVPIPRQGAGSKIEVKLHTSFLRRQSCMLKRCDTSAVVHSKVRSVTSTNVADLHLSIQLDRCARHTGVYRCFAV